MCPSDRFQISNSNNSILIDNFFLFLSIIQLFVDYLSPCYMTDLYKYHTVLIFFIQFGDFVSDGQAEETKKLNFASFRAMLNDRRTTRA